MKTVNMETTTGTARSSDNPDLQNTGPHVSASSSAPSSPPDDSGLQTATRRRGVRRAERLTLANLDLDSKLQRTETHWTDILALLQQTAPTPRELAMVNAFLRQMGRWREHLQDSVKVPTQSASGLDGK